VEKNRLSKIIHRINSEDVEKALAEPQEMLSNEEVSSTPT